MEFLREKSKSRVNILYWLLKINPGKMVSGKNGPRKNGPRKIDPRKNGSRKIGPQKNGRLETRKLKIVG